MEYFSGKQESSQQSAISPPRFGLSPPKMIISVSEIAIDLRTLQGFKLFPNVWGVIIFQEEFGTPRTSFSMVLVKEFSRMDLIWTPQKQ